MLLLFSQVYFPFLRLKHTYFEDFDATSPRLLSALISFLFLIAPCLTVSELTSLLPDIANNCQHRL